MLVSLDEGSFWEIFGHVILSHFSLAKYELESQEELFEESANEFPLAWEAKGSGVKQKFIYSVTLPFYVLLRYFLDSPTLSFFI